MASTPDIHCVGNFFEKIQKPPQQDSFLDGMKYIFDYVRTQPSFMVGQLHENIDPQGRFPFVNFVAFSNSDFHVFQPGKPPEEWINVAATGIGPRGTQICYPGGYKEIATTMGEVMATKPPKDESSCYLLLPFKDTVVGEANFAAFESDWKAKSGATILSESCSGDVKLGDFALYKRILTGITPYLYVLRCEVQPGSTKEQVRALVPTLREKLAANGIPFDDIGAYSVCFLGYPKKE
ncbi:uncharacterized protein [Diadema antillarum]|uniref:uncharacterized protein n=1 Tax=Diadema antillarum TaxID=105358 RepID=UPI003A8C336D